MKIYLKYDVQLLIYIQDSWTLGQEQDKANALIQVSY